MLHFSFLFFNSTLYFVFYVSLRADSTFIVIASQSSCSPPIYSLIKFNGGQLSIILVVLREHLFYIFISIFCRRVLSVTISYIKLCISYCVSGDGAGHPFLKMRRVF